MLPWRRRGAVDIASAPDQKTRVRIPPGYKVISSVKLTLYALLEFLLDLRQSCQMVCFQTKNPNLGKFWLVLQYKMLVYFMVTWTILRSFVIFYGHLV
jgi:hypothetical protein